MSVENSLVLVAEAAKIVGVSPRSIRRYAKAGKLPGMLVGAETWVFQRGVVAAFAAMPRRGPGYPKGRPRKPKNVGNEAVSPFC